MAGDVHRSLWDHEETVSTKLIDAAIERDLTQSGRKDFLSFSPTCFGNRILADPPWQFNNRTGKMAPEHRRLMRILMMTMKEIMDLPAAGSEASLPSIPVGSKRAPQPKGWKS